MLCPSIKRTIETIIIFKVPSVEVSAPAEIKECFFTEDNVRTIVADMYADIRAEKHR